MATKPQKVWNFVDGTKNNEKRKRKIKTKKKQLKT